MLVISAAVFAMPFFAHAAVMSVVTNKAAVVGQPFRVDVALDTQGDDANAVQGTVTFPADMFSFEGVNDGNSPVSLWVEAPYEISPGAVSFSGIIPGGFKGTANSVVGVMLVPIASGTSTINIVNAELLRNDGAGTPIALRVAGETVTARAASASGTPTAPTAVVTVPGNFTPVVANDPAIYGGKYFLVFSATDKGSGINHYEVAEVPAGAALGQNTPWVTATSPYLLKDQTLSSDIYVRAVNNAGGATVAEVPARSTRSMVARIASIFLPLAVALFFAFVIYFIARSRRKRRMTGL